MKASRSLIVVSLALGLSLTAQPASAHVSGGVAVRSTGLTFMDTSDGTMFGVKIVVFNKDPKRKGIGCKFQVRMILTDQLVASGSGGRMVRGRTRKAIDTSASTTDTLPGDLGDYELVVKHCHFDG